MSGRDQEQQMITSNKPSSMKGKLVLGIAIVFAVSAVACFVALTANRGPSKMEADSNGKRSTVVSANLDNDETHLSTNLETANTRSTRSVNRVSRQARRPRGIPNPRPRMDMTCISHPSNKTIPAAHIKGHSKWSDATAALPEPHGYQQRWRCSEFQGSHQAAYVDGGMIFNQTDKSLHVPTCGYYHVFSQVLFELERPSAVDHTTVFHMLKYKRNCNRQERQPNLVLGKSSLHVGEFQSATTYTGDVIKLCAGGRVWVEIPNDPNGVPCCPKGDEQATFLGAVLVAKTTCHWPPNTEMENLNE